MKRAIVIESPVELVQVVQVFFWISWGTSPFVSITITCDVFHGIPSTFGVTVVKLSFNFLAILFLAETDLFLDFRM